MPYPSYQWSRQRITVSKASDLRFACWYRQRHLTDTLSALHMVCRARAHHNSFQCSLCEKVNRFMKARNCLERTIEDLAGYEAVRLGHYEQVYAGVAS